MKLWTIHVQSGVPEAIKQDVPNFVKDVPNFVKDVSRVPECVLRLGSTSKHFFMDSKMKLWTIHVQMGIPEAIGSNVPNLMKDVPNFVKEIPKVPKCVLRWGLAMNPFLMGWKIKLWTFHVQMVVSEVLGSNIPTFIKDVPNFVKDAPRVPKWFQRWESTPNHFFMGS